MQKILRVLKACAKYFTGSAGGVSMVIGFVALAVSVPPFISLPIIFSIGIGVGIYGAWKENKKIKQQEEKRKALENAKQVVQNEQEELLGLGRKIDKKVAEIVEAERKIEEKLTEQIYLEQKIEHQHGCHQPKPSKKRRQETHVFPEVTIKISNLPTFFMAEDSDEVSQSTRNHEKQTERVSLGGS